MNLTKTQMMQLVGQGACVESFHHATLGMFDVSMLRLIASKLKERGHKPLTCRFEDVRAEVANVDPLDFLIANREVDRERVKTLTDEQLEDEMIFILCPPGTNGVGETHLLVDGVHRMVARKERGKEDFNYWLVPLDCAPMVRPGSFIDVPWGEKEVRDGKLQPRH